MKLLRRWIGWRRNACGWSRTWSGRGYRPRPARLGAFPSKLPRRGGTGYRPLQPDAGGAARRSPTPCGHWQPLAVHRPRSCLLPWLRASGHLSVICSRRTSPIFCGRSAHPRPLRQRMNSSSGLQATQGGAFSLAGRGGSDAQGSAARQGDNPLLPARRPTHRRAVQGAGGGQPCLGPRDPRSTSRRVLVLWLRPSCASAPAATAPQDPREVNHRSRRVAGR